MEKNCKVKTSGLQKQTKNETNVFIKKHSVWQLRLIKEKEASGKIDSLAKSLQIHWRLSTILETSNKSVWSNVFWYVKVCIFWKCIQYTIHWDKTQMLKKFPSDKINGTKNALFFLSRAPTHHSFTFNLRFLYISWSTKVRLSKTVCEIFHFWFRFVFIKVYIFVQQNAWILWL